MQIMNGRKLCLYISMSLDGFLATKDDDLSWLSIVEKQGEDYGYADFIAHIDTYIVGRKTYDKVIQMVGHFPQAKQFRCYVITRQHREPVDGVTFYNGDMERLIRDLKKEESEKHIYCDGGGEIVRLLMEKDLIDEYTVSIIPVILGNGKRLFQGGTPFIGLEARPPRYYDTGLVQLGYKRK